MKRMRMMALSVLLVGFCFLATAASADMIENMIKNGLKYYQKGEFEKAKKELEFAVSQLMKKKADSLARALPPAPAGWKAEKPRAHAAGGSMMGGGVNAQTTYRKESGQGRVQIQIMTDSPMLQAMAMALSNPMLLQSSGAQLVEVQGQRAMLKDQGSRRAQLTMLLDNRILIQVSASRLENPAEAAQMFANKIDFKKLSSFGK